MSEPSPEISPEVSEADVAEHEPALHVEELGQDEDSTWPPHLPEDAAEGDAAEQIRVIELDEDDYR